MEVLLQNLLHFTMLAGSAISFLSGSVVSSGNFVCAEGFGRSMKIRSCFCSLAVGLHRSLLLSWDPYLDLQRSQGGLRSNAPNSGLG